MPTAQPFDKLTEQEVVTKMLWPMLQERGIEPHEITQELSFTIPLGRNAIRVDSGKEAPEQRVRLDMLIKRCGKNFCVVEAKKGKLTNKNRDQAISYARNVHPIAPYAIVSNGFETHVYDSFSKEQLTQDDLDPQVQPRPPFD